MIFIFYVHALSFYETVSIEILRREKETQFFNRQKLRPCLVHSENQKVFKIPRYIESCGTGTCMEH